ncbi:kinase-like protein [Basidiobolus meristosporus CBS 931.73]|uniref:Kinase-like protein n=1 Tax=Basidiobolus meristosporus CBS 931.73 TaxID=1314790 RepID=A0A1Y1ZCI9_9FUNG|nr:kinase-like protein [Basidiobolus meristosporus CBS 931.73]|eukprot:ORY07980.1 kinase-like protein [Basidiobolus meristosporus CBS 931.73]
MSTSIKENSVDKHHHHLYHFGLRKALARGARKTFKAILPTWGHKRPHTPRRNSFGRHSRPNSANGEIKAEPIPNSDMILDLKTLKNPEVLQIKVTELIRSLIPSWGHAEVSDVKLHRISGALTNCVFLVEGPAKKHKPEGGVQKILLRVYGEGVDQLFIRDKELCWLSRLSSLGIGPKLLGLFRNGRLEEYIDSTTLTRDDIRDPSISRHIARRLMQLHTVVSIYPPEEDFVPEMWLSIDKWYPLAIKAASLVAQRDPEARDRLEAFDLVKLGDEIDAFQDALSELESPVVFAHNDTQYGNILRAKKTNELIVIDFEYSGYNYRAYDIANHFCEWTADYLSEEPHFLRLDKYPSKEEQYNFLSAYEKIEKLYKEVNQFAPASHLLWGLWGLVQASQSGIEFDYFKYGMQRLEQFRVLKDQGFPGN